MMLSGSQESPWLDDPTPNGACGAAHVRFIREHLAFSIVVNGASPR